ncbi:hypothetical protein ANN_13491 [Periplaneta americana]|uniref:Uncharacterized protein n=1 Tax=Periplaneta americana TaxID=6978 RepID=A0ABQ8TLR4_PERAM|nr:hypothetical protein ANN_13491 [Periplaneta americana]
MMMMMMMVVVMVVVVVVVMESVECTQTQETVRSGPYLDMLENFFEPQLQQENNMDIVFQQDGAPPLRATDISDYRMTHLVTTVGYLTMLYELRGYLASMRLVIARWYLVRCARGFAIDYLEFTLWLGKTSEKTQPVLKRWGSWLEACNYYAHHLQSVKKVVQSFDPDDAAAIQIRQELLNDRTIEKEVTDIKSNFLYLPNAIIRLGTSGVELVEQINIMRTIVNKLSAMESEVGKRVGEKINRVLIKNDGYSILSWISDVLTKTCPNDIIQHVNLIDVSCFKYLFSNCLCRCRAEFFHVNKFPSLQQSKVVF